MLDAAAYWPPTDRAYFFRNDYYIRYRLSGGERVEEVVPFAEKRWTDLPYTGRIDAVATVLSENALYFFKGSTFAAYSIPSDVALHTEPIEVKDGFNLPEGWQGDFDTVVFWPPNGKMYFFKGDQYVRYNLEEGRAESQPQSIAQHWKGLTFTDIDASFVGSRGTAYFFKGGEYIRYIVAAQGDRAREPARPIEGHWPGLLEALMMIPPSGEDEIVIETPPDTSETGDASRVLEVGFNYPWAWQAAGEYFGGGTPPGSEAPMDRWITDLQLNLRTLKDDLNIRHVRIFLLCNAWNYGTVTPASGSTVGGVTLHNYTRDKFTPPSSLHPKYLDHLDRMLKMFQSEEMLVIPSVIDYAAFHPLSLGPGKPRGGRADILNDFAVRLTFFNQVLEEFVKASIPYKGIIYAWEVMNEPIWNTNASYATFLRGEPFYTSDVSEQLMIDFLKNALELIERYEFPSTVGYRYYDDLTKFRYTGSKRQFHYYPLSLKEINSKLSKLPGGGSIVLPYTDPDPLPDFSTTQAFIGEFACKLPGGGHGGAWPELKGLDTVDVTTAVYERLRLLNKKRYRLALVWPDLDGAGYTNLSTPRDTLKLSSGAQAGIKKFMASP